MHIFWVSNGSIQIKVRENFKLNTISHITDSEKVFSNNELLREMESESNQ